MLYDFKGDYDVIVCGGGTAGTIASIAASRSGAKTLLVERGPLLGGISVMGFYPHTFYTNTGKKAIGGIAQELIDELIELGGSLGHLRYEGGHLYTHTPVDNEMLKVLFVKKATEAGVDIMFNSLITDVIKDKNDLKAIVVKTKGKTQFLSGKVFIDSTGDGDVAYMAGAPFNKGRENDGKMQPVSLTMRCTNVDKNKLVKEVPSDKPILWAKTPFGINTPVYFAGRLGEWDETEEAKKLFTDKNHQIFCLSMWSSDVIVNTSRLVGVDGTNYDEINSASIESRLQVLEIFKFLKKYVPGFENSNLVSDSFLGVRETRRFIGDYEITEEDILKGNKFEDNIALGAYPIDMHDPEGGNVTFIPIGGDGAVGIPYRSLLTQDLDNLYVAGRCLSASHVALASVRSIATCMAMGHGIGLAASMIAKNNQTTREIDIKELQEELLKQNAILY